ncbi:hypothetical protein Tco_0326764, partial [Tanacetum coccineum]
TMADVNVNAPAEQALLWHHPLVLMIKSCLASNSCQLDEQWFDLTKDTLRDALQITPLDTNNAFSSPPTPDALIKFVNDLGYPRVVRTLSDAVTNDMFQLWRALTTVINLCLMGKTSGFERPRAPVLQFLGYLSIEPYQIMQKMWESKGTKREVLDPIPNDLITDDIRGEQYYNAYLEKVAKHQRYLACEEVSDPDSPDPKPAKATKPKASSYHKPLAPKATIRNLNLHPPSLRKRNESCERDSDEEVPGIDAGVQDEDRLDQTLNLKLPTKGEVRLEEPASSVGNPVLLYKILAMKLTSTLISVLQKKSQSNPIYKIAEDTSEATQLLRASLLLTIPSNLYFSSFETLFDMTIKRGYRCQLDVPNGLISPTGHTQRTHFKTTSRHQHDFLPPTLDALIKFVNDLGYPRVVRTLSNVVTNDMFQPWRALTTVINLCLTGKTSRFERQGSSVEFFGIVNTSPYRLCREAWKNSPNPSIFH